MITGEEFNKLNKGKHFVKLTEKDYKYIEYEFHEGLNEEDFIEGHLDWGELDFYEYDNFEELGSCMINDMTYIWDVKIPDNANVISINNKINCDKFILSNRRIIWDNYELCLRFIKKKHTLFGACELKKSNGRIVPRSSKTLRICVEICKP